MDPDELVEQLARLLWEKFWEKSNAAAGKPFGDFNKLDDCPKDDFRSMARECLRQMEWARQIGYGDGHEPGPPYEPLTLAPPEWKP